MVTSLASSFVRTHLVLALRSNHLKSRHHLFHHPDNFRNLVTFRLYSGDIRDEDADISENDALKTQQLAAKDDHHDLDTTRSTEYEQHQHGPYTGAAHQATHRVTEKLSFAMLERIADRYLGRGAKNVGEKTIEKVAERVADRAAERISERISERAAERIGERIGERAAERIGERIGERAAERLSERAAERSVARAAERIGDHIGERITERAAERAAEHILPRASTLAERVFFRIGRGFTVALPALGSLFVLHLARQDRIRAQELQVQGNKIASRIFWLAFIGDASDVVAHVITVTCLLQNHYNVGIQLPHGWLHLAETGGVYVAVFSTVAAIVGELLAAGVLRRRKTRR